MAVRHEDPAARTPVEPHRRRISANTIVRLFENRCSSLIRSERAGRADVLPEGRRPRRRRPATASRRRSSSAKRCAPDTRPRRTSRRAWSVTAHVAELSTGADLRIRSAFVVGGDAKDRGDPRRVGADPTDGGPGSSVHVDRRARLPRRSRRSRTMRSASSGRSEHADHVTTQMGFDPDAIAVDRTDAP